MDRRFISLKLYLQYDRCGELEADMFRPVSLYVSRITLALGGLLLFDGAALAQSLPQVSIEQETDRPGKDYKSFDVPSSDVRKCKEPCARDKNCKAYTFVKAGVPGRLARCYLKSSVPDARRNSCCISGVKQSLARWDFPFRYDGRHFKKNEFIYWGRAEHGAGAGEQLFAYDLGSMHYELSALARGNPNWPKWAEYNVNEGQDGSRNAHWHIYGKPVYAMEAGTVIAC